MKLIKEIAQEAHEIICNIRTAAQKLVQAGGATAGASAGRVYYDMNGNPIQR